MLSIRTSYFFNMPAIVEVPNFYISVGSCDREIGTTLIESDSLHRRRNPIQKATAMYFNPLHMLCYFFFGRNTTPQGRTCWFLSIFRKGLLFQELKIRCRENYRKVKSQRASWLGKLGLSVQILRCYYSEFCGTKPCERKHQGIKGAGLGFRADVGSTFNSLSARSQPTSASEWAHWADVG